MMKMIATQSLELEGPFIIHPLLCIHFIVFLAFAKSEPYISSVFLMP